MDEKDQAGALPPRRPQRPTLCDCVSFCLSLSLPPQKARREPRGGGVVGLYAVLCCACCFAASIPPVCCMGMVSCLRRYVPCTRWWLYLSKIFSLHRSSPLRISHAPTGRRPTRSTVGRVQPCLPPTRRYGQSLAGFINDCAKRW